MASFTGVGDNVTLQMSHKGDTASVAISGTYAMEIELQREQGSPGSGSWEVIKRWVTANATVAYSHITKRDKENLRLIVVVDTSGTATATLTDTTNAILNEIKDSLGNVRMRMYQDGMVFYNEEGYVISDTRLSSQFIVIGDVTAYTVLAANSGKTHFWPDVTSAITITLPTPEAGLNFEFIYAGGAADAQNAVITAASDTYFFKGGVLHLDSDAGAGSDELVPVYADGNSNSKITIATPGTGTRMKFWSDGTNWYIHGLIVSVTAPTIADQ